MPDHDFTPTAADYALPLAEHLADLDARAWAARSHTSENHRAALRLALYWRAAWEAAEEYVRGSRGALTRALEQAMEDAGAMLAEHARLRALLALILDAGDYEGLALACAAARRALCPDAMKE